MGPKIEETKGKVEQAAGDLTDNEDLKRDGQVDEAAGKAKGAAADAADALSDAASDAVDKVKDVFKKD